VSTKWTTVCGLSFGNPPTSTQFVFFPSQPPLLPLCCSTSLLRWPVCRCTLAFGIL
jgi:hypothetical protein